MKPIPFPFQAWVSCLLGVLGWTKGWILTLFATTAAVLLLATFWHHETASMDVESQRLLAKMKRKTSSAEVSDGLSVNSSSDNDKGIKNAKAVPRSSLGKTDLSNEQISRIELMLPPVQATKASPLGKFLGESKLKGVTLKQVDYIWSKAASRAKQTDGQSSLGVGKIEVSLNLEGTYPAVRAWLGELLYEESNVQINAVQFQRMSRDSSVVNGVITLSVYFQEAT
jgi:hypothetical protein